MAKLRETKYVPSPIEDAMELHKAFHIIGCDNAAVARVLSRRDAAQRSLILREYKSIYGHDLISRLKSKLFFCPITKVAVVTWMLEGVAREVYLTRKWMLEGHYLSNNMYTAASGLAATRRTIDLVCSRTSSEIPVFKQCYASINGTSIEKHIKIFISSSSLRKLLTEHVSAWRPEGVQVQTHEAENDARLLYKASAERRSADKDIFIMVFTRRSAPQIVAVSEAYARAYGHSIVKAIWKATPGLFGDALITILMCAYGRTSYFAKVLRDSMSWRGADIFTVTWVIVTRAEIDLHYIKSQYFTMYNKSLSQDVYSKTSGSCRTFLLNLIGQN